MRIHLLIAVAAGVLAACSAVDPRADAAGAPGPAGTDAVIRYACEDGLTVDARYPTIETARIGYGGETIDMAIARSASGARYVGGGREWWTKGTTEGTLTPLEPGEEIASAGGLGCTAGQEPAGL